MTRKLCRNVLFLVVVVLTSLGMPSSSIAQSTPDTSTAPPVFVIQPKDSDESYFSLEIEAGSSVEATAILAAEAESAVPVTTFAADAYSLINGGFGVRELGEDINSPTTWLDYQTETVEIEPDQPLERTFTITVPENTPPGQYITGLILQTAEPISVGSSTMLQQTLRTAVAVLITVPGPIEPEFSVGSASLQQSMNSTSLIIDIVNTGNILVKPSGDLTLTAADGTTVVTAPIAMGSVYAGTKTQLEVPIPTLLEPGDYSIALDLTDLETETSTSVTELPLIVSGTTTNPESAEIVESFSIEPVTDASGTTQLANVLVNFQNPGQPVPSVRSTLTVSLDGIVVEDYVISSSMALPIGTTQLEQRYVPATGWQVGTYTFGLTVEAIDLATGQITVLQQIDAQQSIVID